MYIKYIIRIIDVITILRIVVNPSILQRQHKLTIEGLGSSVGSSRCSEKEQNPSIPHSIWRHNKASIIDIRQSNHDEIQAMTAMKLFAWKQIAVNPVDTFILGMTKHQTIVQCKVTLVFCRVLQFQCLKKSNNLKHNVYN